MVSSEALQAHLVRDLSRYCAIPMALRPGLSLTEARAYSLSNSLLKKYVGAVSRDADSRALDKFLHANSRCAEWAPSSDIDIGGFRGLFMEHLRHALWDFWNCEGYPLTDHPFHLLERGRTGPGANRFARDESLYAKLFASTLTASSPQLYQWYKAYIARYPLWVEAEANRLAAYGEARCDVLGRLSFVPKNDQISRCIVTEPTLNTVYQLGLGAILEERLKGRFGIDLSRQPYVNRDLACLGSITDGLVTIDLASASDSMSLNMLRYILPKELYELLMRYRSPAVEIPGRGSIGLNMVSTMGNGFTFPLQTLLFSATVVVCMQLRGLKPFKRASSAELWSVFGDDIICPASVAGDVITALGLLGFTVNDDKSFLKGPFRESCGEDYWNGSNIRGVYLKKLDTQASLYSAVNQLVRWSCRNNMLLPNTVRYLLAHAGKLRVPIWEDMSAGIHVPRELASPQVDRNGTDTYKSLVPAPRRYRVDGVLAKICVPYRRRSLIFNPQGLEISFVRGAITNHQWASPDKLALRWRAKRRWSPNWDFFELDKFQTRSNPDYGLSWRRWRSVVRFYLRG